MPITDITSCHGLAVPTQVMQHVVHVESGSNPLAIGIVGARLERQPQNLEEAVATARMLESQGYNYSLGIAQVNRANLERYGLDSYDKAFEVCPNLIAGTQILAQCYARAGGNWGKAFSCYYSGDFARGYADGYVQKIFESINRSSLPNTALARADPIPLAQTPRAPSMKASDYLVRMRSSVIGNVGTAEAADVVRSPVSGAQAGVPERTRTIAPLSTPDGRAVSVANARHSPGGPISERAAYAAPDIQATVADRQLPAENPTVSTTPPASVIFEPLVRGPNDLASPAQSTTLQAQASRPGADGADLRWGGHDDAFVF